MNTTQTSIFTTSRAWELQQMINKFFRENNKYKLVDIKYNNCPLHLGRDHFDEAVTEYSALVIYTTFIHQPLTKTNQQEEEESVPIHYGDDRNDE